MARRPAMKMTIWKPSPAQIAGASTAGSACVGRAQEGLLRQADARRAALLMRPIGTGW